MIDRGSDFRASNDIPRSGVKIGTFNARRLEATKRDVKAHSPLGFGLVSMPPASVVDALRRHKAEVVAMLRSGRDAWSAEDWLLFFEERAAIAEFDGRLSRTEADAQALACCIVEWLNRNPTPSAPGRCCQAESKDAVVLPYGVEPGTHIWLHAECWPAWQVTRRSQAREALARMGIGCVVTGGCGHTSNEPQQR
jgi:hypothetical protein